jgi:hypothetical protein
VFEPIKSGIALNAAVRTDLDCAEEILLQEPAAMRSKYHEPVALSHHRLNEARLSRVITQDLTDFANGCVDSLLRIQEDVFTPESLNNLLSGDDAFAQHAKYAQALEIPMHQLFYDGEAEPTRSRR